MTAIGVTNREGDYNRQTEAHDWKRRGERLIRVSGLPYTIVRPGWFDYNKPDEHRLVFLQGDRRHAGDSSDGVIARRQLAQVLVASLTSEAALRKSFELVATHGPAQPDLEPLFAALDADPPGELDAVHDLANMPLAKEPQQVRDDLDAVRTREKAVMLHWHLQEGRSAIPKSTKPARIAENFDVFDFELSDDEIAAIDALDTGVRGGPEPDSITLETYGRDIPDA